MAMVLDTLITRFAFDIDKSGLRGLDTSIKKSKDRIRAAGTETTKTTRKLGGLGKQGGIAFGGITKGALASAVPVLGLATAIGTATQALGRLAKAAVSEFLKVEQGFARLQTLVGIDKADLGDNLSRLGDISIQTGADIGKVQFAFEKATSAGLDLERAYQLTEIAAKAQAMGLGDASGIVQAASSHYLALGTNVEDTAKIIHKTAQLGTADADTVAAALAQLGSYTQTYDVSAEELGGIIAAASSQGKSGQEVGTQIQAIFASLAKPQTKKALADFGLDLEELRIQIADNFPKALADLKEAVGPRGIETIFRSVEAQNAINSMFNIDADTGEVAAVAFTEKIKTALADNEFGDAWEIQAATVGHSIDEMKASWQTFVRELGTAIAPLVKLGAQIGTFYTRYWTLLLKIFEGTTKAVITLHRHLNPIVFAIRTIWHSNFKPLWDWLKGFFAGFTSKWDEVTAAANRFVTAVSTIFSAFGDAVDATFGFGQVYQDNFDQGKAAGESFATTIIRLMDTVSRSILSVSFRLLNLVGLAPDIAKVVENETRIKELKEKQKRFEGRVSSSGIASPHHRGYHLVQDQIDTLKEENRSLRNIYTGEKYIKQLVDERAPKFSTTANTGVSIPTTTAGRVSTRIPASVLGASLPEAESRRSPALYIPKEIKLDIGEMPDMVTDSIERTAGEMLSTAESGYSAIITDFKSQYFTETGKLFSNLSDATQEALLNSWNEIIAETFSGIDSASVHGMIGTIAQDKYVSGGKSLNAAGTGLSAFNQFQEGLGNAFSTAGGRSFMMNLSSAVGDATASAVTEIQGALTGSGAGAGGGGIAGFLATSGMAVHNAVKGAANPYMTAGTILLDGITRLFSASKRRRERERREKELAKQRGFNSSLWQYTGYNVGGWGAALQNLASTSRFGAAMSGAPIRSRQGLAPSVKFGDIVVNAKGLSESQASNLVKYRLREEIEYAIQDIDNQAWF